MQRRLIQLVRRRAGFCCEYCRTPQRFDELPFEIDHIIASQHGGPTVESNLALSCFVCNRNKGPNLAGIDPQSGRISRLFHPRRHQWNRHFVWEGARLRGRTPIGRATIVVLRINEHLRVWLREELMREGVFPV